MADLNIQWNVRPLRKKIVRGVFALVVAIAFLIETYLLTGEILLFSVCSFILLYILSPFFFPTEFILEKENIIIKRPLRKTQIVSWSQIKSYYLKGTKIFLFQEKEPLVLVSTRAVPLELPEREHEQLLKKLIGYFKKIGLKSLNKE